MTQRSVPAPFLTKTYQLVEDPETNDVVSWTDNGTAFTVWKTADFARDLLPKYFKHNNFSSFVRQLNTYGFRKVVPDKWEFANENFRRAQKELLSEIRRRKAAAASSAQAEKHTVVVGGDISSTPSSSAGEDLGSTSTSVDTAAAPKIASAATVQFSDLSGENEKLKKDNEVLSSELAQKTRQCGDLIYFLTKYVKVGPDQIDRIMREGRAAINGCDYVDDEIGDDNNEKEGLKLFGVWVNRKRKIGGDEKGHNGGTRSKEMKRVDFHAPPSMMKIGSKVCS